MILTFDGLLKMIIWRNEVCADKAKKIEREKTFHTLNVEQLLSGFSEWLQRFRGVATKYLQNYLKWYLVEVQYKGFHQYLDLFMMFTLYNRKGIKKYQSCRMFIE